LTSSAAAAAGSFFGDLDALVGLARDRREPIRGGAHLPRGNAELVERPAHHVLEFANIALENSRPLIAQMSDLFAPISKSTTHT
jgi:hypothetical protein